MVCSRNIIHPLSLTVEHTTLSQQISSISCYSFSSHDFLAEKSQNVPGRKGQQSDQVSEIIECGLEGINRSRLIAPAVRSAVLKRNPKHLVGKVSQNDLKHPKGFQNFQIWPY